MKKKRFLYISLPGIILGILFSFTVKKTLTITSTDKYCASCHTHPHATQSWKKSTHYINPSGIKVHCVECHLPPQGKGHYLAKIKTGTKDLWGKLFRDSSSFNWAQKSRPENAVHFVYETSCIHCHQTLFPVTLTKEGEDAHLYYTEKKKSDELHCINCHISVGHYDPNAIHAQNLTFGKASSENQIVYQDPANVVEFKNFIEYIPSSTVSFNMKAIPGGKFKIGSPNDEVYRKEDEGPVKEVEISPFFMAEIEVTWNEYMAFYSQTSGEGKSSDTESTKRVVDADVISGATPPYGQPDQNWGLGDRPAITMTWHAAETYCKWLSKVTGKNYRLPTEAEWEFACRAGSEDPYFFGGDPKKFQKKGFLSKFSSNDTAVINSHVIYFENSNAKTQPPGSILPNKFGLKNMIGNVAEFCLDWYSEDAYKNINEGNNTNPVGPVSGSEHVVRGGSFKDHAGKLRSASRSLSKTEEWLKTDPQIPKSIWWYSDCSWVGFRVICEFDNKTGNTN